MPAGKPGPAAAPEPGSLHLVEHVFRAHPERFFDGVLAGLLEVLVVRLEGGLGDKPVVGCHGASERVNSEGDSGIKTGGQKLGPSMAIALGGVTLRLGL
jgi:hypothetical protein